MMLVVSPEELPNTTTTPLRSPVPPFRCCKWSLGAAGRGGSQTCETLSLGFFVRREKGRQLLQWCQPPGWNGIPGCPALAGSGVSTSRLMTTGSCPLLTTTASQISFGLPLIS
jgi:hypothetical protein